MDKTGLERVSAAIQTDSAEQAKREKALKPPMELVLRYFPVALRQVARVAQFGDQKHGSSWGENHPEDEDYYLGATVRHLLDHVEGKSIDSQSGMFHLAHAAFDILAMLTVADSPNKNARNQQKGTKC